MVRWSAGNVEKYWCSCYCECSISFNGVAGLDEDNRVKCPERGEKPLDIEIRRCLSSERHDFFERIPVDFEM